MACFIKKSYFKKMGENVFGGLKSCTTERNSRQPVVPCSPRLVLPKYIETAVSAQSADQQKGRDGAVMAHLLQCHCFNFVHDVILRH
jgi:hypothetical protein